jgi:3-hydroxyacyl-CoA dehydrogenase
MGAGIAQVGAQTGHKVTMVDLSQEVLDKSQVELICKKINHKHYNVYVQKPFFTGVTDCEII